MSDEHNTHFYSLEEIKRTLEATKEFEDGEQIYYFIGTLRYAYDKLNKQKEVLDKAVEYINYYGTTPEENDDATCRYILKSLLNILKGKE